MSQIVINGNNIDILKTYPDNYFDAVVTDPPYGLGKEPNAAELMKDWVEHGYHEVSGSGFMGKEWDAFVPQPVFWKEVFRVLKHGGHVLSFFGTRTYDWGVMSMRFAGFEVRDCIQWLYGSGFPKSHNISKSIDKKEGAEREVIGQSQDILKKQAKDLKLGKRKILESLNHGASERNNGFVNVSADITAPSTEAAKQWEGWGSALKPANEPIVLARKPLEKGLSIAENILKWGVGGINIDATRIGLSKGDDARLGGKGSWKTDKAAENVYEGGYEGKDIESSPLGRFPANIILTHHPECECIGTKKVKAIKGGNSRAIQKNTYNDFGKNYDNTPNGVGCGFGDENGQEEVENWDCHEDCPIRILDEQSGISKSNPRTTCERRTNSTHEYGFKSDAYSSHSDTGGASRFFYVAKASKAERNKGLEGFEEKNKPDNYIMPKLTCSVCGSKRVDSSNTLVCGCKGETHYEEQNSLESKNNLAGGNKNFHPTVKPVKLMQYLVKMITPPNGIVLDPFCGSGTTGVACKLEGFQFVGMEQDPEYSKIAEGRINNYKEEKEKTPKNKPKEDNKELITTQTTLF
jgi:site-specific DNA-methyltransferase (adenine-specific)